MGDLKHYVISGGVRGRERLKMLARVMQPMTSSLLDRVGIDAGMKVLDVGCGSGAVSFELAKRVGSEGKVIGADLDQIKIELANDEASQLGVSNVEFCSFDIRDHNEFDKFDVVYARFLLTHLADPFDAAQCFFRLLKAGGKVIVEDIDFSGHFVHPPLAAFDRYRELYCTSVRRRGGDPNIGPRVPKILKDCGFVDVDLAVVQPVALTGETKLLGPITLENIAEAAIAEGLTTQAEIDELVGQLYDFAADPNTVSGLPRIVQTWGRKEPNG